MPEEGGIDHVVFDWRQFSHFYEGNLWPELLSRLKFGHGRNIIQDYFKGKTLVVEREDFKERVELED